MAVITLRAVKGSPLTNEEVDGNFTNLNTELAGKASTSALDSYQPLLGYTPVNKAGDTFTGSVLFSGNTLGVQWWTGSSPRYAVLQDYNSATKAELAYYDVGSTNWVSRFRWGAAGSEFLGAVSFDTAPTVGGNAVLTSITGANVTTALGYTPANKAGDTFTGNVGIGVTPSPWVYGGSILELTNNGVVATAGPNAGFFTNSYYDGSSFVRKTANPAMYYSLQSGTHLWGVAATGAAGSTISFTQVMTLDAGGNLAVGTSSALSKFTLEQSGDTFESGITVSRAGANRATVFLNASNDTLNFGRGGSTAMSIGASGQLGIGGANYGTTGQVLTSQGAGSAPVWANASGGGGGASTGQALAFAIVFGL